MQTLIQLFKKIRVSDQLPVLRWFNNPDQHRGV